MAWREHFTNGRSLGLGTGVALVSLAFGAHIAAWPHWITIGMFYGSGLVLVTGSSILVSKSYFAPEQEPDPLLRIGGLVPTTAQNDGLKWVEQVSEEHVSAAFVSVFYEDRGRRSAPATDVAASLQFQDGAEGLLFIQRAYWINESVNHTAISIGTTKKVIVGGAQGSHWLAYENIYSELPDKTLDDGTVIHHGMWPRRLKLSPSLTVTIRVYSLLNGRVLDAATFPLWTHDQILNREEGP